MSSTSSILSHFLRTPPPGHTTHAYLIPNFRGLENFLAQKPDLKRTEIAAFASASEGFSQRNLGCGVEESLERFERVVGAVREVFRVRGYVSMVVGCPYDGPTDVKEVSRVVRRLLDMGCYEVSLGDTVGIARPAEIRKLIRALREDGVPVERLAGHFHDTYGMAVANVAAAMEEGVRVFDASVAGLGGCPYAKGASGNLATEDLVYFLEGEGVKTGVDLDGLAETGSWISGVLGRANSSSVGRALEGKRMASKRKEGEAKL